MSSSPVAASRIARLILQDFRTYASLDLTVSRPLVALVGENGAGKTNVLEAISLFMPGRGLRRAELSEMARNEGPGSFAVSVTLDAPYGEHRLGTGLEPQGENARASRICRIDGMPASSPTAFAEYLRIVWLTPDLDALFRGAAGDRRRFLDRLVLAVDAEHGTRVNALERALRSRNRVLEENPDDRLWLDALEREVAELAIAVAAARRETVERLASLILETREQESPFPFAMMGLEGEIDALVATLPAVDAEDRYRAILRDYRSRDRAAGRTLVGPQASDLLVRHGPKDIPANTASTGEQKALLIGLVLAHARLVASMSGIAPFVLLDEVAAHLDPRRRAGLYDALETLGGQVWMTGADPGLFQELDGRADLLHVAPGHIVASQDHP
ncbi:DNA replication/repair protein RecF [Microvirga tunisiensis]|jgi:DNA replication and repair protein RecF|uniref:DNA replication and repair protein RecF n=1 Tax=Microvirga tunisiensis TaxID=2108360 RepID=A0A5N7MBX9_9HYPH|nr:DNA replication/repair protein RecF [Microvirga tunisiensis]MPR06097.1 DNA replication/repair protein RecF [Microvirga tunisiensis]MPR24432.1 DNA replication/repair protein RecF [Microvirga tunisiensis]